ncbi:AraC family transcriptional regulator [Sphingobacterium sp. N143]|uniref:helix-turn-helix domain-containing protein n=1 Tax=Sphingobacterium sp. N143 TaxID=2746727 RepID=UPI002576AB21|nr:helix-turn-helix domain-containing protein [Sphingobacterium sp. N143]MDM1296877.1 AraC family transcriptional regulator [Sphingobacterium sp. N143]
MEEIIQVKTISEFHRLYNLPKPLHPLISLVDYAEMYKSGTIKCWSQSFYSIALKKNVLGKFNYGQLPYDFDEGLMSFFAPGQILNIKFNDELPGQEPSGWILLIHPDFLWNTTLAKTIKQYEYFGYAINEALFLSDEEEYNMGILLDNIREEYSKNMDDFSKKIIISQIELLLNYADRYYKRQFITRERSNHELLTKFEELLELYFNDKNDRQQVLPTVKYFSEKLNKTPDYLSSVLKNTTGSNASQHIQLKLIEVAKLKLSTTALTVSEIAYDLGFEQPQSLSKLFKRVTRQTPLEFRNLYQQNT